MEPVVRSAQEIEAWGNTIMEEVNRKKAELFGDESLRLRSDSELSQKIQEFVLELLTDFPRDENENVFINSSYTATPIVCVKLSHLESLVEVDKPNDLFGREVGYKLRIPPLVHNVFGTILAEATRIELRNMEDPSGKEIKQNEWTKEKADAEGATNTCINSQKTIGIVNIDPTLQSLEVKATVRCGTLELPNHTITFKTREGDEPMVYIPLPHLTQSAKIAHDGTISFPNGKTFSIQETMPPGQRFQKYLSLGSPFRINLNFEITPPSEK